MTNIILTMTKLINDKISHNDKNCCHRDNMGLCVEVIMMEVSSRVVLYLDMVVEGSEMQGGVTIILLLVHYPGSGHLAQQDTHRTERKQNMIKMEQRHKKKCFENKFGNIPCAKFGRYEVYYLYMLISCF